MLKRKPIGFLTIAALLLVTNTLSLADDPTGTNANFARIQKEIRDPSSKQVLVFAHRGGWRNERQYNAPENSIANLHKAVRLGYDGFESDVARTKDGHLVIMHDPTVDRTTNGAGLISEMTLAQVKELRLKFNRAENPTDQQVPTLNELLSAGKDRIMFKLDLKCSLEHLPDVLQEIDRTNGIGQTIVRVRYSSANAKLVSQTLSANPRYKDAIILFRCNKSSQVSQVIDQFHPKLIEIMNAEKGLTEEMREMAKLILDSPARIEAHSSKDHAVWKQQVDLGMRVLHTTKPMELLSWLKARDLHW